ncbi:hypothetical protein ACDX78_09295 [Virgibacillus oceani]
MVELSPELYNTELENLHEMLLEYTITNYEDTIENIYFEHPLPDLYHSEALEDAYMGGLIPWIILHETPPHKDHTTSLENTIHDIQKIMEEQDFKSEEEMNTFLDQLLSSEEIPSPSSDEPRYIAQEKLDKAQQIKGPKHAKKKEKLIKEALEIHPSNPDAFVLLANDAKSSQEYHHLVHQEGLNQLVRS